jgi:hypothetical protein
VTVAELIEHLQAFPADARVIVPNFHSGFDDVTNVQAKPIMLGASMMGEGAHSEVNIFDDEPLTPDETAVVIDC